MPLPVGVWKIDANGVVGNMEIDSVDGHGNITGTLTIDAPHKDGLAGFWNEASQSIIFQRLMDDAGPTFQLYSGYLFRDPLNNAANPYSLAGYFEAFGPNSGATAQRPVYGWYAQWTAQPPPPPPPPDPGGVPGGGGGGPGPHPPRPQPPRPQ
jgi:hypothetical protein